MVHHNYPQIQASPILANTNYPPQGLQKEGGIIVITTMLFEDGVTLMEFEQNTDIMEYE